jgi:glycosyltransferase involved in cell wall biosynthesis
MLETGKYIPVIVATKRVLANEIWNAAKTESFEDKRVKTYQVPNLVKDPLSSYAQSKLTDRISFLIFNGISQLLYFLNMMLTLFIVTIKERPLIIHVHNPPDLAGVAALVVSKFRGIPMVFEIHDLTPELFCENMGLSVNSAMYRFLKVQERLAVRNSAALITVSNSMFTHFNDSPVPKIVIYSGWKAMVENYSEFSEHDLRSKYSLENKHIILYQGKIGRAYDVDLSLRAMTYVLRKHSDTVLVYVGEGEDKHRLELLAKEMGLETNVLFIGFVPRSEVFEWIKTSDVTVLTLRNSLAAQHAVPNKLLEYMALGKPIVAARLPGVSEVMKNGYNGLLYTPGSAEDLAECLITFIEDPTSMKNSGSNSQQDFCSKYCYEKNMPKLISLYDSLVCKSK